MNNLNVIKGSLGWHLPTLA